MPKIISYATSAFKNVKSAIALNVVYQNVACVVGLEVCLILPAKTQDTSNYPPSFVCVSDQLRLTKG